MPLVGARGGLGRGLSAIMPEDPADQVVAELARRVDELERELARHEQRTEAMTAEQTYLAAASFVRCNPDAYALVVEHAKEAVAAGERFSVKREFEDMRGKVPAVGSLAYRYCNAITPAIARMVVVDVPEVDPYLRRGKSKVDKYFDGTVEPPEPWRGGADG